MLLYNEAKIAKDMKSLGLTRAEVLQMYEDDKKVDRMGQKEVNNDLTKEQQSNMKKMKNVSKGPTVYKFSTKRERKPKPDMREVIQILNKALEDFTLNAEGANTAHIANIEHQIDFVYNGKNYSVNLTEHREK